MINQRNRKKCQKQTTKTKTSLGDMLEKPKGLTCVLLEFRKETEKSVV